MKVSQYGAIERAIATADAGSIRERWLYGLRLLADPEAIAPAGGLRHGVADRLIEAAKHHGFKLSEREVRYRMQCARTYPKESQIGNAVADFGAWRDLISANFPAYPNDPSEPPADWRTVAEQRQDRNRRMTELGQPGLFPVDQFEPAAATLKDLFDFRDRQRSITESFLATDRKRSEYLEALSKAVGHDWSKSWRDAHLAAFGVDIDPDDGDES